MDFRRLSGTQYGTLNPKRNGRTEVTDFRRLSGTQYRILNPKRNGRTEVTDFRRLSGTQLGATAPDRIGTFCTGELLELCRGRGAMQQAGSEPGMMIARWSCNGNILEWNRNT